MQADVGQAPHGGNQKNNDGLAGCIYDWSYPVIGGKEYRVAAELSNSIYKDADSQDDKETLRYVTHNYEFLKRYLKRSLKVYDEGDAGDILGMLYEELNRKDDYVVQLDEEGNVISLANFIKHTLKNMRKRFYTDQSKRSKNEISNYIKKDSSDEEEDLFALVPDKNCLDMVEYIETDLETLLYDCRGYRYELKGIDLFEMLYLFCSLRNNKEQYTQLLRARGISESISSSLRKAAGRVEDINQLLTCITKNMCADRQTYVVECLEKYVYGVDSLKAAMGQML